MHDAWTGVLKRTKHNISKELLMFSILLVSLICWWKNGWHLGAVFKYPKGIHNVIRVDNATAYEKCLVTTETEALSSGNDVITLTTPGKTWYICGVIRHCAEGEQKIAIEVLPKKLSSGSGPSPSTTSASKGSSFAPTHHDGWMIAIFGILVMIIIV